MDGMNPDPEKSYSIADRFRCDVCGEAPRIVKADGRGPITITFSCHGESCTKTFDKSDLVFNQTVFKKDE